MSGGKWSRHDLRIVFIASMGHLKKTFFSQLTLTLHSRMSSKELIRIYIITSRIFFSQRAFLKIFSAYRDKNRTTGGGSRTSKSGNKNEKVGSKKMKDSRDVNREPTTTTTKNITAKSEICEIETHCIKRRVTRRNEPLSKPAVILPLTSVYTATFGRVYYYLKWTIIKWALQVNKGGGWLINKSSYFPF